jgi:hypothetical protein
LPDFTGVAAVFAAFFADAFAAGFVGGLRALAAKGAFDDADGFDFATGFLDFEAALAMI